jgi:hypothetical protein
VKLVRYGDVKLFETETDLCMFIAYTAEAAVLKGVTVIHRNATFVMGKRDDGLDVIDAA